MTDDSTIKSRRRKVLGAVGLGIAGIGIAGATQDGEDDGTVIPEEEANAYGNEDAELDDGPTTEITIRDQTINEGDNTLIVENVFLAQPGYVTIHDARTRFFGEGDVQRRILESLIGVTPVMGPGPVNDVEVELFNRYAPAVTEYDRSGPLSVSQPVIAVPHVNDTGPEFQIEVGAEGKLQGDVAFTRQVVRTLDRLAAANDIALVTVEESAERENALAKAFEEAILEYFCVDDR